jgi:predicted nuclease of predicted toxin-antitoxin system
MRLKLDKNLPLVLRDELAAQGHDAHTCHDESLQGAADGAVFAAASGEGRTLITLDLDFADIRRYPPGGHPGVVVLRPARADVDSCVAAVARFLFHVPEADVPGNLVIVEDHRVRIRRPPP